VDVGFQLALGKQAHRHQVRRGGGGESAKGAEQMTLVRRALLALGIALATAFAVAGLAIIDASSRPQGFEKLHRD
jgi:hypothetical protein